MERHILHNEHCALRPSSGLTLPLTRPQTRLMLLNVVLNGASVTYRLSTLANIACRKITVTLKLLRGTNIVPSCFHTLRSRSLPHLLRSAVDPGCVKTCTEQKSLESYSRMPPVERPTRHIVPERHDVCRAPEVCELRGFRIFWRGASAGIVT